MKKLFVTILLLLPVAVVAQDINQQNMQNMMALMREIGMCMQSIDQKEMKTLENETNKFEAEMKGLCNDGKRDEAQKKALVFSKKLINSSTVKALRKCTEKMSASMKEMMPDLAPEEIAKDFSNHHVCDEI